jgi:hypothetical protein
LVAEAVVPASGTWFLSDAHREGAPVWVRVPGPDESPLVVKLAWERLRHLQHPCVPEVVGWDAETSSLAVACPPGVPLTQLLESRREPEFAMSPGTVLDAAVQLSDALVHAHEQGRPHGHLEPSDVWVTPTGRLVVWGFGDGPSAEPSEAWRSPERARGQRASGDADQWALGAIVAALVTGREPWVGETAESDAKVGDASHLSQPVMAQWKPLGRVVERALASEGKDRFSSVHPMAQALSAMSERVRQPSGLAEMAVVLHQRYGIELPAAINEIEADGPTVVDEAPTTFDLDAAPVSPAAPAIEMPAPIAADFESNEGITEVDRTVVEDEAPAPPDPSNQTTLPDGPAVVAVGQMTREPELDPDAVATLRPTVEPELPAVPAADLPDAPSTELPSDLPVAEVAELPEIGSASRVDELQAGYGERVPVSEAPGNGAEHILRLAPIVVGAMFAMLAFYLLVWVP